MGAAGLRVEKWSGARNEFLLIEKTDLPAGVVPAQLARRLCNRGPERGADGLLLLDGDRAHYWNVDGSPAAFCGNGARCVGAYLMSRSGDQEVSFFLGDVGVRAWSEHGAVAVAVPPPTLMEKPVPTALLAEILGASPGQFAAAALIDAGVPHLIMRQTNPQADENLWRRAADLRRHPRIVPAGTNIDLVWAQRTAGAVLEGWLRTWERGLAAETRACGSGAVAAAALLFAAEEARCVTLATHGGRKLHVETRDSEWILRGSARCVSREMLAGGGGLDPATTA